MKTYNGEKVMTLREFKEITGISIPALKSRLRNGKLEENKDFYTLRRQAIIKFKKQNKIDNTTAQITVLTVREIKKLCELYNIDSIEIDEENVKKKKIDFNIKNLDNLTDDEKETLNRLIEKANKKSKVFKPEIEQKYFFIDTEGNVSYQYWVGDGYDDAFYVLGNCFGTRKQAEFALEKQKVYTELKHYALEHNEDVFDWRDGYQRKYYIFCKCGELKADYAVYRQNINSIYFTSEEIAKNAIAEIGEDKIKKYLFEVEE